MWFWRRTEQLAGRTSDDVLASGLYEEGTFRHFLALERSRAEKRGRSLLLLLVDLGPGGGRDAGAATGSAVFDVLEMTVRESDFVGWYEASRVAGAVLVQGDAVPTPAMCSEIGKRTAALLKERLPGVTAEVRVLQLEARGERRHA